MIEAFAGISRLLFAIVILGFQFVPIAKAQTNEEQARAQAKAQFRSTLHLRPTQPLEIQRREDIEEVFDTVTGVSPGAIFFYKGSPKFPPIDGDSDCFVALMAANGTAFLIKGFGLSNSFREFNRMLAESKVHIVTSIRAQAIADLYLAINPENRSMNPISSLLDLKQAAERQCQAVPFDPNEKDFEAWWKQAKARYSKGPFSQTATRSGSGYVVEWTVLSSSGPGLCGGAPLRAGLEVAEDGQVGRLTAVPLRQNHR